MGNKAAGSIDSYLAQFTPEIQEKLQALRTVIREAAPEAEERIAYGIASLYWNGPVVHFAAYARHIGFYPTAEGIDAFRDELAGYRLSKGTVQFPIDEPLPFALIGRITAHRMEANRKLAEKKKK